MSGNVEWRDVSEPDRGSVPGRSRPGPIFIQGIMPRCGTNFLADLLLLHPDCAAPEPIWESFLLQHGELLEEYVERTARHWDPKWGVSEAHGAALRRSLGDALIRFLECRVPDGRRVVTKTPSVKNLHRFQALFPDAYLVVLVRDGRAVVESGARTFGWNREEAMYRWAGAAREVLSFHEKWDSSAPSYSLIRYVDLHQDVEGTLRALFARVGLDPERYDFEGARSLPVKGSSGLAKEGGSVHWKPVERPKDFRPLERWRGWEPRLHARFNWLAGKPMESMGYSLEPQASQGRWRAWNRLRDVRYRLRNRLPAARAVAGRVARALGVRRPHPD